jgi:outer membrane protein OmpA-like peptidoglycan-associated protein
MSSTGKVLFMTIENKDAIGLRDIFVSFLKKGKWTKPQNIGTNVNSIEDEMSPFLAADGKTLYFSSEGLPGYGYNDVYVTRRLDDTWTNWSDPLNLGKGINKTGSESYFTVSASGEYGFISRVLDEGFGGNDIYRIKLSESAKPDPLVLIHGKVLNKKTNNPISTEIRYFELGTNEEIGSALSAPGTGEYQISLPKGKKYAYYAKKEGFYSIEDNLDLVELEKFERLERDLYLAPIEKGEVIRLNNIFFETGKATLLAESNSELDKLVLVLKSNKKLRIKILGHTDNVGSNTANQTLSENRAKAVHTYLIEKGIKSANLEFVGYGESKPLETNETKEGRAINRRVEFEVL